ncbi:Pectate lyase [Alteromonadaceae bacterium Bs31]|nr:Pectate lyase [Alteromonadaceae bacterium Bs31]
MYKKILFTLAAAGVALTANAASNRPADYKTICKIDQTCSVSSSTKVAFGASGKFVYKTLSGSFKCNVSTFGSDPIPSKSVKECSIPKSGSGSSSSSDSSSSSSDSSDSGSTSSECGSGGGVKICLSAKASGSDIKLSWSKSGSPDNVEVYRDTDSNPSGRTRIGKPSASATSFTDTSPSKGKTYYYWIKFRKSGTWYNSGVASAKTTSDSSSSDSSSSSSSGSSSMGSACTSSKGTVKLSSTKVVDGTFDGGCKTYLPTWGDCGQKEGQDPVFRVNGGTLKNVIVGNRGDGIHVYGNATIENVTWPDVCEDGLTVKKAATVTIKNITANDASDKFIQVNAKATVNVSKAKINNVLKMFRENGGKCYPIKVSVKDSDLSKVNEAIFRTDCSSSTFTMSNTKTSSIKAVCKGKGKCTVK